jgi:hypothetical protein
VRDESRAPQNELPSRETAERTRSRFSSTGRLKNIAVGNSVYSSKEATIIGAWVYREN